MGLETLAWDTFPSKSDVRNWIMEPERRKVQVASIPGVAIVDCVTPVSCEWNQPQVHCVCSFRLKKIPSTPPEKSGPKYTHILEIHQNVDRVFSWVEIAISYYFLGILIYFFIFFSNGARCDNLSLTMGSLALSRSSSWRKSLELADGSSATAKVKAYEGDWRKALQLCKAGEPQKSCR